MPNVEQRITSFILETYPKARKHGLTSTSPLLESGIIDSLGVLELVGFVEKEFTISVVDDELMPENFESVERLVAFVEAKCRRNGTH